MTVPTVKDATVRNRVVRNTISNYLGQIVVLGTGFALTPFVLHQLGATVYGLWLLVGSVVAYGGLLDLGIATAVIKYVAEYHAREDYKQLRQLVSTALILYVALGVLAFLLSIGLAFLLPVLFRVPPDQQKTAVYLVLLMGLSLGIAIPSVMTNAVLRGLQRFDLANSIAIIGTLLASGATVAVLLLGGGVIGMVAVGIPISLVMQIPAIWLIRRVAPQLHFKWSYISWKLLRTVFSYSWSLFLGQLAGQFQTKTDEIMIGAMLPISAVTPYALARRLSEVPQALSSQFVKILLPLASQLHVENDQARLRAIFLVSTRLALASCLPITCAIAILAQPLLTAWVGPNFADSAFLVLILAMAGLIDTILWPAGAILQGMNRHRLLAAISVGSGLANLLLSIALVRPFGVTGVALGTLIPTTIECFVFVMPYALRIIGVSVREACLQIFLPAIVPALPMILILYGFSLAIPPSSLLSIMIIGSAGILVYILGYLSIGTNTLERRACRDAVRTIAGFTTAHLKNLWL